MAHQDWRENAQSGWAPPPNAQQAQYYGQPPPQGQPPPNYQMGYPPPMPHGGGAPPHQPSAYHNSSNMPPMAHPNSIASNLPPPGRGPPMHHVTHHQQHSHAVHHARPSHARPSSRDPRAMRRHRSSGHSSKNSGPMIDVKAKYAHQVNTVLHIAKDDYRDGFACLLSQIFGSPLIDVLKLCTGGGKTGSNNNSSGSGSKDDYIFPLGSTAKDGLIFDGRIRLESILSYLPQAMTSSNKEVLVFELQPLAAVDSKSYDKFVQHYSSNDSERAGVVDHEFDMGIVCYFLPPKMVKMSVDLNKKKDDKNKKNSKGRQDKNAQGSDGGSNLMNIVKFFGLDDGNPHFSRDLSTGIGSTNKKINSKNVNLNVVWMIGIVSQNKLSKYLKENDKDVQTNNSKQGDDSPTAASKKTQQRKPSKRKHKPKVKSELLNALIRLYTMADEPYTSSDEEMT